MINTTKVSQNASLRLQPRYKSIQGVEMGMLINILVLPHVVLGNMGVLATQTDQ